VDIRGIRHPSKEGLGVKNVNPLHLSEDKHPTLQYSVAKPHNTFSILITLIELINTELVCFIFVIFFNAIVSNPSNDQFLVPRRVRNDTNAEHSPKKPLDLKARRPRSSPFSGKHPQEGRDCAVREIGNRMLRLKSSRQHIERSRLDEEESERKRCEVGSFS